MSEPALNWIKNDPAFNCFEDGSKFLVALQVRDNRTKTQVWEFAVVRITCDGDYFSMDWPEGEPYSDWNWSDFEYFHVMEGVAPWHETPSKEKS